MIRINSITIKEFRGIRDITLDFRGKNFAICGPNGTGKSGIVDALEFAITGTVSRLSGEGRGDISVKQHAPHVDMANDPSKARVILNLTIASSGKTVTVERSVKNPREPKMTPNDLDMVECLRQMEAHPEIVLSRRELIRYVLATPGKRADEVRALLHLEEIEQVRAGLQKITNNAERYLASFSTGVSSAVQNLLRVLVINKLTSENILSAANTRRNVLGLPELTELTATCSLKEGMMSLAKGRRPSIPKVQAIADIQACKEVLKQITNASTAVLVADITAQLTALDTDSTRSAGMMRETFYKLGYNLIEEDDCPFCNLAWDRARLKAHIQSKMEHLRELARRGKIAEQKILILVRLLRQARSAMEAVAHYGSLIQPVISLDSVSDFARRCATLADQLGTIVPVRETISRLKEMCNIPKSVREAIAGLEKFVKTLPEPSKVDAARDFLSVGQERLEDWRKIKRDQNAAKTQAELARKALGIYSATSDGVLAGLYADVQKQFADLYSFINRTDEEKFAAKLIPSMGKLGFDVDFYGRGFFPPGAYHSEGHQDGMGLCLYLALMRHLQGNTFTLAILDDVLMSVDRAHRREVCFLLKKEFPNTQFIITTHDPIWLKHMKTEGLIMSRAAIQFRTWCVDSGPIQWDDRDIWAEMDDYIQKNDVRSAAALLRHYLEYISGELCHRLRAPVEFRGDAQYQLGELLPAAFAQMRKLLGRGKVAANSWNQRELVDSLAERDAEFSKAGQAAEIEKWQVNAAIHFNSWDDLVKEDFETVAKAFHGLLTTFTCRECGEFLRVSPERETPEILRCDCGTTNINLRKKSL